jgi:hypothetical protein
MRKRLVIGPAVAATAALLLGAAGARAGMLEPEACDKLKAEHETLTQQGLKEQLAKGPEWAKAQLPADKIERLRRYLAIDEDIKFRCPVAKPRPTPEQIAAAEERKEKRKAARAAKAAEQQTAAAGAVQGASQTSEAGGKAPAPEPVAASADGPAPKPKKRRSKPAHDDAYVPPPKPAGEE